MAEPLRHPGRPCSNCPWRLDAPPGEFPACRYESLTATAGRPGKEVGFSAPIFACHRSRDGEEFACAGWLATVGYDHLGMRLAVAMGRLEPAAFEPGPDWPPLYATYADLAVANGVDPDDEVLRRCR